MESQFTLKSGSAQIATRCNQDRVLSPGLLIVSVSLAGVVLIMTVAGCAPLGFTQTTPAPRLPPGSSEARELSEPEMQEVVREKAKGYFREAQLVTPMPEEYEIRLEKMCVPLLKMHALYTAYGSFQMPGPVTSVIAVNHNTGHAFALPAEFNDMTDREALRITMDTALQLVEVYLAAEESDLIVWGINGCRDSIVVLSDTRDIPYQGRNRDPANYSSLIGPPSITETNDGYLVEVYTWRRVGGEIARREFAIHKSGQLVAKRERLGEAVGDCTVCITR